MRARQALASHARVAVLDGLARVGGGYRALHRGEGVLILPPAPGAPGSVGDEALLLSLIGELERRGATRLGLLVSRPTETWLRAYPSLASRNLAFHVFDGGARWPARLATLARLVARYQAVYGIGADVIDGNYNASASASWIEILVLAARMGVDAHLVSFSFDSTQRTSAALQQMLRRLPGDVSIVVRDPVSRQRFEQLVARQVTLGADLAFLLEPARDARGPAFDWVAARKREGAAVVGVTPNRRVAAAGDKDCAGLVDVLAQALARAAREHGRLGFVLVPHDARRAGEGQSDLELCRRVLAGSSPEVRAASFVLEDAPGAAHIKALCRHLDLLVTGRMHAGIAALGAGVPVVSIGYNGKFEGLYKAMGLTTMLFQPQSGLEASALAGAMLAALGPQGDEARRQIAERLPAMQALARLNLEPVPHAR